MSAWQVRHEGSPHVTAGLTPVQVLRGLHEGVWAPTDEVRGPGDNRWHALDEHPQFEEAVAEYEPPKKVKKVGEDHLDMNPLIDVALVLLIFFILTTTYDALRRVIDMPAASQKGKTSIKSISAEEAKLEYIRVKARNGPDGKPIYEVDGQTVSEENLQSAMYAGKLQKRNKVIIDVEDVSVDTFIKIIDAGRGAELSDFKLRVKE